MAVIILHISGMGIVLMRTYTMSAFSYSKFSFAEHCVPENFPVRLYHPVCACILREYYLLGAETAYERRGTVIK